MTVKSPPVLLAVGDSIANGTGQVMCNIHSQSWALHVAQAAGWAFYKTAAGGATSSGIVDQQLRHIGGGYEVAALSMGANDVLTGLDPDRFAANLTDVAKTLTAAARHVLVLNLPERFGRLPGAPSRRAADVAEVNARIQAAAVDHGLLVVDVRDLTGMRLVRADRVHPTALGQLVIADRATDALRSAGLDVPRPPMGHGRLGVEYPVRWTLQTAGYAARGVARRMLRR